MIRIDNSFIFITFSHPINIRKYSNMKSPAIRKFSSPESLSLLFSPLSVDSKIKNIAPGIDL